MHARSYSPTLGRFLQPDPIAAEGNLYGYAENSPITKADPSGRFWYKVGARDHTVAQLAARFHVSVASMYRFNSPYITKNRPYLHSKQPAPPFAKNQVFVAAVVSAGVAVLLGVKRLHEVGDGRPRDPRRDAALAALGIGLGAVWLTIAEPIAGTALIVSIVLLATLPIVVIQLRGPKPTSFFVAPASWWTSFYAAAVVGFGTALALASTYSFPSNFDTPDSLQNAVVAAGALLLVLVPQASMRRAEIAMAAAAAFGSLAAVAAATVSGGWFAEPSLVVALGSIVGVAIVSLVYWSVESPSDDPLIGPVQTVGISMRQSGVTFLLVLSLILYWGIRSSH